MDAARTGVTADPLSLASGPPATAHMFIINPFRSGGLVQMSSTHPSTAARVVRLEAVLRDGFELVA